MTGLLEIARRVTGRTTGRLQSLPILALNVHTGCNCRCVMCDIWKANADGRELSVAQLSEHVGAIRRMRVRRVMLTGGEPLLHPNLWALCDLLAAEGIRTTLVTTGLLVEKHAAAIAKAIDTVVVSVDGPPEAHDAIRRVTGAFHLILRGMAALKVARVRPRLIARSVVQRGNFTLLAETIGAVRAAGFDELSFLAADVTSTAFNRPAPWDQSRRDEVAIGEGDLPRLREEIRRACDVEREAFDEGFVAGGAASLTRILRYYTALAHDGPFPEVRCNAPWVSAVLEPDGSFRPCFFQQAYPKAAGPFDVVLNSPDAIAFRRALDPATNDTCRRCVCSLNLRPAASA